MNRFTFLLLGVATMAGISHIVSAQQPGMFFATNPNGGGMVMAHGPLGVADASDGIITFNYASWGWPTDRGLMVLMSNYNRTFQVAFTYDHDDSAGSWSSVHLMLSDYLGAPNYLGWCCGGNGIHY